MKYEKVTSMKKLEQSIVALNIQRSNDWLEVQELTDAIADSLKPANMARQAMAEFKTDRDFPKILKTITSFGAGALINQVTVKNTSNKFLRFSGKVLQVTVTNLVNRILKL